jgi:hypothetical protein
MVSMDAPIARAIEVEEVDAADLGREADGILTGGRGDLAWSLRRLRDVEERLEKLRGFPDPDDVTGVFGGMRAPRSSATLRGSPGRPAGSGVWPTGPSASTRPFWAPSSSSPCSSGRVA